MFDFARPRELTLWVFDLWAHLWGVNGLHFLSLVDEVVRQGHLDIENHRISPALDAVDVTRLPP